MPEPVEALSSNANVMIYIGYTTCYSYYFSLYIYKIYKNKYIRMAVPEN
jgi:hypothetical protein